MSLKDLKRDSTPLRWSYVQGIPKQEPEAWMYEEGHGLTVVVRGVGNIAIPWRTIRAALKRKDMKADGGYTANRLKAERS